MNLTIRNDLPSLRNLQNAAYAKSHHPPHTTAAPPPDGTANPQLTAKLQSTMKEQFAAKAQDPRAFHDLMAKVYGEGYDKNKAEALRQKALAGDFSWLPPVRLLDSATLHGANGAYDAKDGVVYINADLAAKNPKLAASTYVEEAGAHLDTMLNKTDSAGDEGEMFRRVMGGEKLTATDIAEIRADDDRGTITVDGKQVSVEFWNPFKSIKNAVKKVASGIGHAVKSTAGAIKDTFKDLGKNLFNTGKTLFGGIGKMTFGFAKNLVTGHVGDAFKSFFSGTRDVLFGTTKGVFRSVFTALGDGLKIPTHLLPDSVGDKIRAGIDKGTKHFVEQSAFATELFARMTDILNKPVADFFGDLEAAVREGISGDFKGLATGFGSAFTNFPGHVKDAANPFFDGLPEEDRF